jgi:class 3 adenylate cyclase
MQPIAEWLDRLGLGHYAQRFAENGIDLSDLRHLTDQDLKDIGVLLGHRRRMLAATTELAGTAPATPQAVAPPEPKPRDFAERRQLTVMFCDLVGSTALSGRLDPEDLRGIIGAYHRCCAELIERNGGFVAKYMGDGVLAYFGYPHAHEHDAERAVRAGLALVEAVPKLTTAAGMPLQVRVGIATGLVVVGDLIGSGEAQERGIVGETPNLAALDAVLAHTSTPKRDAALFTEMLLPPNDGRYPTLDLTPEQRRQRTLQALTGQLTSIASKRLSTELWRGPSCARHHGILIYAGVLNP